MSKNLIFRSVTEGSWGFQPLEALFEYGYYCRPDQFVLNGVLYKTYRNEAGGKPGKPIWVYAIDGRGGWAATSEISEEDLKEQVRKIRHPKKNQ
jgi:hypothetical protein